MSNRTKAKDRELSHDVAQIMKVKNHESRAPSDIIAPEIAPVDEGDVLAFLHQSSVRAIDEHFRARPNLRRNTG